ncbi:MAG: hypothetical protein H0T17_01960 [Propionibacteriales bacterium]|nr:hypothetical protein [Propionibacteriales bacterium]
MSGSRRFQRSDRINIAVGLLVVAVLTVAVSVVTAVWVGAAAIFAVLAGTAASRFVYTEVVQARHQSARERAEQARSFGAEMTRTHREHRMFTAAMTSRLAQRDRNISGLNGMIRLGQRRADEAQTRAERETDRANELQHRLSSLLDEVLAQSAVVAVAAEESDLPTIADLLAWEERVSETALEDVREQA